MDRLRAVIAQIEFEHEHRGSRTCHFPGNDADCDNPEHWVCTRAQLEAALVAAPPPVPEPPALSDRPKRIQRKRTKGWRMPDGAVYVGRPTKWGSDWTMRDARDRGIEDPRRQREWATKAFRGDVEGWRELPWSCFHHDNIQQLRGKDLACWCPLDQPCHADVLLELANAPPVPEPPA